TGRKGFASMISGNSTDEGSIPDIERTQTMSRRHRTNTSTPFGNIGNHGGKDIVCTGMAFIVQGTYRTPLIVIAHHAGERRHRSCSGVPHEPCVFFHEQLFRSHLSSHYLSSRHGFRDGSGNLYERLLRPLPRKGGKMIHTGNLVQGVRKH